MTYAETGASSRETQVAEVAEVAERVMAASPWATAKVGRVEMLVRRMAAPPNLHSSGWSAAASLQALAQVKIPRHAVTVVASEGMALSPFRKSCSRLRGPARKYR